MAHSRIRLILGDQLNEQHSWFSNQSSDTLYVIAELKQEASYTRHHIQKVVAFFAAMRAFADQLQTQGHHVLHLTLDDTQGYADLPSMIAALCQSEQATHFEYQRPDEFRLAEQLAALTLNSCEVRMAETEHFYLPFQEIRDHFQPKKAPIMEHFYRKMRKRYQCLVDEDGKPYGGKWNYDKENRNKLKQADLDDIPAPLMFANQTDDIIERLARHKIITIGRDTTTLLWPIDRPQSLQLLDHFCQHLLPLFGRFQDAMTCQHSAQWSLYHSRIAFALNSKILSPQEVVNRAINAYAHSQGTISLAQIEGFVRQILGWREYVRGIYWANMPNYQQQNALQAQRSLPHYYWTGETQMRCMKEAIGQSLDFAYAHHIQRLMVTGNFALLTGIHPDHVDEWYLGIYIDAIEWVEMPNTRGMALFADGGLLATKPYAASGSYINKMSDYCQHCHYQVKQRSGKDACPFNSLYWHFMQQHRERLERNPRIGMIYRTWDRTDPDTQDAILSTAEHYLAHLEQL